jgi:hypothetical protein
MGFVELSGEKNGGSISHSAQAMAPALLVVTANLVHDDYLDRIQSITFDQPEALNSKILL